MNKILENMPTRKVLAEQSLLLPRKKCWSKENRPKTLKAKLYNKDQS